MYFKGLRTSYESKQSGMQTRIENKQRLALSIHAKSILISDMEIFEPDSCDENKPATVSTAMLNRIIHQYKDEAKSSIAMALKNYKSELTEILRSIPLETRNQVILTLLERRKQELREQAQVLCQEKGCELYFRISTDNIEFLASDAGQEEGPMFDDNVGLYCKAIIEEYCRLPFIEREKIYYKDIVDTIWAAIGKEELLKVVLRSKRVIAGKSTSNIMYMKPLSILHDTEHLYNYLVGMIASDREGPWRIGSVRLSSIQECIKQKHPASISSNQCDEITSAIREKGVQYISDNQGAQHIVAEFTAYGEQMYKSMLHLRPKYVKKQGSLVYEFHCSSRQAENYFFKFGHNVKILEPKELADKFLRRYESAAKQYK